MDVMVKVLEHALGQGFEDRRAIVDVPIPQIVKTNVETVGKVLQE